MRRLSKLIQLYRAIVGWGALQTPWKYLETEMTAQLKAKATSTELPPVLEGMDTVALDELLRTLSAAKSLGYDPEFDYRRFPLSKFDDPYILTC